MSALKLSPCSESFGMTHPPLTGTRGQLQASVARLAWTWPDAAEGHSCWRDHRDHGAFGVLIGDFEPLRRGSEPAASLFEISCGSAAGRSGRQRALPAELGAGGLAERR